jgi:hypothetical protein
LAQGPTQCLTPASPWNLETFWFSRSGWGLLWFGYEVCVCGPHLVVLLWEVLETLGGEDKMEEISH